MVKTGDSETAGKLKQLADKRANGKLAVAFCGHFSAGKSTLVNRLCGAQLLPSSPIPTSANVVTIQGGPRAAVRIEQMTLDGRHETVELPTSELEHLNKYCIDGARYMTVDIVYPSDLLSDDMMLLDTPGIDSTDDAHKQATESALHLADVVFYVMDYNHVQSEINFSFAKELKDWGKPLYLVVNQIDKHRERELSFDEYRTSVEQAFANWHLEPAGILYVTSREPNHPHNEYESLKDLLRKLASVRGELADWSVSASLRHLVNVHAKRQEELAEPERLRYLEEAGGEDAAAEVKGTLRALEDKLAALNGQAEQERLAMRKDVQSLLDGAIITPAALRDIAHQFLESCKPGFKAGLLFAGAKTAAEKERRQEQFRSEFESVVKSAIEWHLTELLRKAAERAGLSDDQITAYLKQIVWSPTGEWLTERVNKGASFGNEYTMTYSRDVAADVKSVYRQLAMPLIDEFAAFIAANNGAAVKEAEAELHALSSRAAALAKLEALAQRLAADAAAQAALLPHQPSAPVLPAPTALPRGDARAAAPSAAAASQQPAAAGRAASAEARGSAAAPAAPRAAAAPAAALAGGDAFAPQRQAAARLRSAAALLAPHSTLGAAARAMREKADRLQSSRFTIALFGAFSAGKSSLANALIGASALPVSPNPTTAAINRIVPPTDSQPHGSARVVMKSKDGMLDDLRYSLALLGETDLPTDEPGLMRRIAALRPEAVQAGGRPHYSFLKAAEQGWSSHSASLDQVLSVDETEYRRFVAEESRSCFVAEIELHYSCPLTDAGIVLVDTPGADSVNARHTGVAFNYIKNADAVLFVTYYNHAFSQADRQFLMQLGRVKDQFELDKMFFLVNAADLASSQEELEGVLKHVSDNLLQHGIRFPRLYPVSSLQALDAKQDGDEAALQQSGVAAFEQSFTTFIRDDLGRMAVESADRDIARTGTQVAGWIDSARGSAAERAEQREKLLVQTERASAVARSVNELADLQYDRLKRELEELLFYVLQRIGLRFGEFYNNAFNPSTLRDDGRDLKKAIWTSWLELDRQLAVELAQELEATTLRMDNALNALMKERYERVTSELAELLTGFEASAFARTEWTADNVGSSWEAGQVEAKWFWSRFKSPRQFFEGDGKAAMRTDIEAMLADPLRSWSDRAAAKWNAIYEDRLREAAAAISTKLGEESRAYADGLLASLQDGSNLSELTELHKSLQSLLQP
ncbi:dynamin family protein [Paenibacillus sp. PR3]|uniref:Dynamin family protein n=2 Tax=Paenibacillus terricola TaxID=2763503 RepID=A0ABR8MS93_9BACL|nr:dynamin family protein [Paenibacillus terricola]